LPLLSAE